MKLTNQIEVKKPDELIKFRSDFSESALKLSTYIISKLKKDKTIYQISVKEYKELFNLKNESYYNFLYKVAEELTNKKFIMKDRDKKQFAIFNFLASIDYKNGILEFEFSGKLLNYLIEIKSKYTKYELKNIISLKSKYSIRLYEILKNELEQNIRYYNYKSVIFSLAELREILNIPKSYKYDNIKNKILLKAQTELLEYTDITFLFNPIKKGRAVDKIEFTINYNNKNLNMLEEQLEKQNRAFKSFSNFVKFLKANYNNNNKYFFEVLENKILTYYKIVDNELVGLKNKKILKFNNDEALERYKLLYKIVYNSVLYQDLLKENFNILELRIMDNLTYLQLKEEIKNYL